jgi:signal transduction histidine kinase/CheY-like chemotaxis protein
MQDLKKSFDPIHAHPILDLVKELTIGQRSTDSVEQLAGFLHTDIFPKLNTFFIEIYFPDATAPAFLPPVAANGKTNVPLRIPADHPLIVDLQAHGSPVEVKAQHPHPEFLAATGNRAHLIIPINDRSRLYGLLYFGHADNYSFTPEGIQAVQTLAAVIGSRMKSMATIQQQLESMRALEYSERLRTALYEISEQAHSAENIGELYKQIHQIVRRLIYAENFYIALVEDRKDGKYIKFPYFADTRDPQFQGMEIRLDQKKHSITGYLLQTGQPLLLTPDNYIEICRQHNMECLGTKPHSWLGAPFYLDNLAGAVAVQSYSRIVYTEKDKELMAFVARHIGDALKRKRAVDELKKAKERAEQAERNKSTFLANMSHEIRTPMNGIIGLTDIILKSDIGGHQRTYLEMVHSSAERLLKLINDILDFSKIEAGKLELAIAPFSLRHTLADAVEILGVSAAQKAVGLYVDCDDGVPDMLRGDADKLHQVLINLVGNGIKFTNQGSVTLTVRLAGHAVKLRKQANLLFQIKDTGIGIPNEEIENVFKAFSQLSTTRDSNLRGTGLGLVIAAELVEMMGGKICVESEPGVGTTFYFSLRFPLENSDRKEEKNLLERQASLRKIPCGHQPLRILLVEDEYINQTLAATVLEREGWEVTIAGNGVQALEIIDKYSFDLILMDIQMPELNGYETTRTIRRKEDRTGCHVPIIAMTAYAVKGDREKCLAVGMDGYVSKPIRPDQLRSEIELVLRRHVSGTL